MSANVHHRVLALLYRTVSLFYILVTKSDICIVLDEVHRNSLHIPSTVTGDLSHGFFLLVTSCILQNKEKVKLISTNVHVALSTVMFHLMVGLVGVTII